MASPLENWLSIFPAYQKRWIYEPSQFAIAVKSRQIGFSFATAAACVRSGLFLKRPQLILSAAQDLSDEVLAKARMHCEALTALGCKAATDFSRSSASEIAWKSGGRIIALPANPRTARSFSGDVYLDEAAYFLDPEGIRDAVLPIVTRGDYRFRACSTPNGAQGMFYDWISNPPPGWSAHSVSVEDAAADGFPVDLDKLWKACGGDERLFAQWYRCSFLDGDLQYIPTALVDRALNWVGACPDLSDAEIHAGLDVGRHNDLTALVVVAVVNGVAYTLAVMTCKRTKFRAQRQLIADARRMFAWQTLSVDATGMGEFAEELVEQYGEDEVKPVTFTNDSKSIMATRSLRWFRDNRIRLPRGDEGKRLHAETCALRRVITKSGNVTYDIPRTNTGHGDRYWALALALLGAGEPVAPRGYGLEPLMSVA